MGETVQKSHSQTLFEQDEEKDSTAAFSGKFPFQGIIPRLRRNRIGSFKTFGARAAERNAGNGYGILQ